MANLSPQLPLVVSYKLLAEFVITPLERLIKFVVSLYVFSPSIVLVPNHHHFNEFAGSWSCLKPILFPYDL